MTVKQFIKILKNFNKATITFNGCEPKFAISENELGEWTIDIVLEDGVSDKANRADDSSALDASCKRSLHK